MTHLRNEHLDSDGNVIAAVAALYRVLGPSAVTDDESIVQTDNGPQSPLIASPTVSRTRLSLTTKRRNEQMPIPIASFARVTWADRVKEVLTEMGDDAIMPADELAERFGAASVPAFYKRMSSLDKQSLSEWRAHDTVSGGYAYGTPKGIEKARDAGMVR